MSVLILLPILCPIIAGAAIPLLKFNGRGKELRIYVSFITILNTILSFIAVNVGNLKIETLSFTPAIRLMLKVDDMSRLFVVLASILWLLATFYTFEYIKHEGKEERFFTFFLMTLGIIVGIGFAGNLLTLYMFYEAMTLITYPLVVHSETPEAMNGGSKYLMYSFFGAAFALVGFVFLAVFGQTTEFVAGGTLDLVKAAGKEQLLLVVFLFTFMGFGCKAGMWPLFAWLPAAHPVAPAPASALLSGVITKAGVLAIIRVTFYMFGVDFVRGTWAQATLMVLALFTVFMGSMLAYKEKLFKRRLAYSSVSQVSYVLFGLTTLNPIGFLGALLHMVCHAVIKNALFLSAGAIIYKTHKTYVYELKGIGKTMPITMWCFTLASLALVGIPPTAGVVSKWYLAMGGISSNFPKLGTFGAGVLLISALLTAGYLITVFVTAFFPGPDFDYKNMVKTEPNRFMTIPLMILGASCVVLGMFPGGLINFINNLAATLF